MNKILLILLSTFFLSITNLSAAEKPCSQYNYWTENYKYKKCMAKIKKEKGEGILSKMNKNYKAFREKTPKSGVETWKKIKNKEKQ